MKASEAKIKSVWNSIPEITRSKIQFMVERGLLYTYMYKSSTPEAFDNINTIIVKLQLLGYKVECDTVDAANFHSDLCTVSTDTKLTITW